MTSRLARDTQVLRWKQLTAEETEIIKDVNNLIKDVVERAVPDASPRNGNDPWATPEMNRFVNIIMLDGPRGSGKTSLLLTLIAGWQDYRRLLEGSPDKIHQDEAQTAFDGMNGKVRCLRPLDFDPLPRDLPIYNWIIQAFEPLVARIGGRSADADSWEDDHPPLTLRESFGHLQDAATLGWTTGLLKDALARNIGDFLVWQGQQQSKWQELEGDWRTFVDDLLHRLEDARDSGVRLPKQAVIVLPIDDLDLQASRTRELLLALRLLRHDRIVYVLTGDSDNLKTNLQVDFFRDCVRGDRLTEALHDEVRERSGALARGLFDKVIPDTQRFSLKGLALSELLDWPKNEDRTIREILSDFNNQPLFINPLGEMLRANSGRGKYVTYRALQAFHDRWKALPTDRRCFGEFLKMLIGRISEEPMRVEDNNGAIELSENPSVVAPAPRHYQEIGLPEGAYLYYMSELDFARLRTERKEPADAATPEHTLAIDLSTEFATMQGVSIRLFSGPRFADHTIGLVWSVIAAPENADDGILVPWPILNEPKNPAKWKARFNEWKKYIDAVQKRIGHVINSSEELLVAWFRFTAGKEDTPPSVEMSLGQRLLDAIGDEDTAKSEFLARLASPLFGLPDSDRRAVIEATRTTEANCQQIELAAHRGVYRISRSRHDLFELAMRPSDPDARVSDDQLERFSLSDGIRDLIRQPPQENT